MTQTHKINAQTPGPLRAIDGTAFHEFTHFLLSGNGGALGHSPKPDDAELGYTRYKEADACLLAAGYTMLDKAGRTLGIDAAELGESIDLAALIQAALIVIHKAGDEDDAIDGLVCVDLKALKKLGAQLAKLPKPAQGVSPL